MEKEVRGKKRGTKVALGAGIAALTAAAVAYFLVGPEGKRNRKKLKGWTIRMKGEIIEKLEQVKEMSQPVFDRIVAQVEEKYRKIKNISPEELDSVVKDIKSHWKSISKKSIGNKKASGKIKNIESKTEST